MTPAIRRERWGTRTRVYLVFADQPAYPNQISGKVRELTQVRRRRALRKTAKGHLWPPHKCVHMYTRTFTHMNMYTYTIWFFKKERQYMRKIEQEEQVEKKQLGSAVVYMYLLMCVEAGG